MNSERSTRIFSLPQYLLTPRELTPPGDAECAFVALGCESRRTQSDGDARADVVAKSDSPQEMGSVDAKFFSGSKCRWDRRATWLRTPWTVNVVRFVRVRQHPVCERRLDRPANDTRASNRRDLLATILIGELDCPTADGQLRSRDHGCQCVESMLFDFFENFVG